MSYGRTQVLLVEDEQAAAEIVMALISSEADLFSVEWRDSLRAGLERLEHGGIDLVLLDFGLPDSQGLETFLRAHRAAPDVAIVPLTATGDEELALRAIKLGAEDYLFKGGINKQLLVRTMRYAIERKRNEEALRRAHHELERRVEERTAELRRLSHRLVEIQELERRNIAHELHDEIGQLLTGLKLLLEMATRLPTEGMKAHLGEAQTLLNELMTKVRNLSLDLRPPMLDDLGLLHALLWHLQRYTAQTQIKINFSHPGLEPDSRFLPEVEIAAYRIVQEALTNVARYAGVREADLRITADIEMLTIRIADQGKGFDVEPTLAAASSVGLAGMRERARLLGGTVQIDAAPGQGTQIQATLPCNEEG